MVAPDEFIPVAEGSPLICDLDRWVLGEATRQLVRWRSEHPAGPGAAGDTGLAAWNLAGLPSLVTPLPGGSGPGCVQLVGRPGSEARLLATAALLAG